MQTARTLPRHQHQQPPRAQTAMDTVSVRITKFLMDLLSTYTNIELQSDVAQMPLASSIGGAL